MESSPPPGPDKTIILPKKMSSILIDPAPGMYPNCVCDQDPSVMCEFPCWQQIGINPDFDPADKNGCCCKRRAASDD